MEIGSYFWLENTKINQNKVHNNDKKQYLLSGRTAIDYALSIIEKNRKIKTVYFPSYCCQSMIDPFIHRNIQIDFYTVSFSNGNFRYDINCEKDCDIFFAMNYFGFSQYNMDYYIEKFKIRNICVIEDSTHSILSKRKYNKKSDYVVASLRKWFPIISGGILINQADTNIEIRSLKDNDKYIRLKEKAMLEKRKYINGEDKNNKLKFLEIYTKSEELLDSDYKKYSIDEKSYSILKDLNIEEIIRQRQNNSKVIYKTLQSQSCIQYPMNVNLDEDVPLFIPIFMENRKRENLRNTFLENDIYCPVHWKIPENVKKEEEKNIYNRELSLICDQRYKCKQIEDYIQFIN